MNTLIRCALTYFLIISGSFTVLLEEGDLNQQSYVSPRIWDPSINPFGENGQVSLEVVENGNVQTYVNLHKGAASGKTFDPVWTQT